MFYPGDFKAEPHVPNPCYVTSEATYEKVASRRECQVGNPATMSIPGDIEDTRQVPDDGRPIALNSGEA